MIPGTFQGPLYADLHSLFQGLSPEGRRFPRELPERETWLRAFDAVQMNEDEFDLLGGASGDLHLLVRLLPNRRFRVDGRNISVDLTLAPWEAALGATIAVETPDGDTKVKVPAGTSSGKKLRLRGRGMPNANGSAGDLYAVVKIAVPKELTDQEQALFAELSTASDFNPRRAR